MQKDTPERLPARLPTRSLNPASTVLSLHKETRTKGIDPKRRSYTLHYWTKGYDPFVASGSYLNLFTLADTCTSTKVTASEMLTAYEFTCVYLITLLNNGGTVYWQEVRPAAWGFQQTTRSHLVPESIYCASASVTEIGLCRRPKPRGNKAWTALKWQCQTMYWLLPRGEISPSSANCLCTYGDWIPYGIHPRQHCWFLLGHQSMGWALPW